MAAKVKYCGNCNPDVDPGRIKGRVEGVRMAADPETLIIIHGCSRECLMKDKAVQETAKKIVLHSREVADQGCRDI